MFWFIPVALRVLTAFIILPILIKKVVSLHSRTKRFFLQYFFCCLLAIGVAIFLKEWRPTTLTLTIAAIGFANGLACYCQWKAIDISLSRTALFTLWDDLIAMGMGYFILGEGKFINWPIGLGIAASISAIFLFARHAYYKKKEKAGSLPLRFFAYVGFYSVIWGLASFAIRFWALKEIGVGRFLWGWYGGALVAAIVVLLFYRDGDKNQENHEQLSRRAYLSMFVIAAMVFASMGLEYWSLQVAPLVVIQPLFLVGEMIIPALIGLLLFKEHKNFDRMEWVYFVLGIMGSLLIVFGF